MSERNGIIYVIEGWTDHGRYKFPQHDHYGVSQMALNDWDVKSVRRKQRKRA